MRDVMDGVVIFTAVQPGSPLCGIVTAGDQLIAVDGTEVHNAVHAAALIHAAGEACVAVRKRSIMVSMVAIGAFMMILLFALFGLLVDVAWNESAGDHSADLKQAYIELKRLQKSLLTDKPDWQAFDKQQKRFQTLEKKVNNMTMTSARRYRHTWLPANSRTTRVALLYHGAYYRTPNGPDGHTSHFGMQKCTDFFQTRANHEKQLYAPLMAAGATVSIFVHTFASCSRRDAELVRTLKPTRYEIVPWGSTDKIVDSYLATLRLLRESGLVVDFVILTRFDLVFRVPVVSLDIVLDQINVAWRAEALGWYRHHTTSDLFYAMPYQFVDVFSRALAASGDYHGECCPGAAHWVYNALASDRPAGKHHVHFVEQGFHPSTQDVNTITSKPSRDLFVAILRACPRWEPMFDSNLEPSYRNQSRTKSKRQCGH